MAKFAILLSIEIEADSYENAYEIEKSLQKFVQDNDQVKGVHSVDVEQQDFFEDEEWV